MLVYSGGQVSGQVRRTVRIRDAIANFRAKRKRQTQAQSRQKPRLTR